MRYLLGATEESLYREQQPLLEAQRSCSFRCKYCVYHKNLSTVSYYSLERVYKELGYLIVEKKILALRIFDSIFTNDLPRAKKILEHLVELKAQSGVKIPWIYWEFNYDMVDEQFLRLASALKYREKILNTSKIEPLNRPQLYTEMLRDYTIINCVGVQSFCKEALKAMSRALIDTAKFERFMNIINENNLVFKIDMILGLPLETFDSYSLRLGNAQEAMSRGLSKISSIRYLLPESLKMPASSEMRA